MPSRCTWSTYAWSTDRWFGFTWSAHVASTGRFATAGAPSRPTGTAGAWVLWSFITATLNDWTTSLFLATAESTYPGISRIVLTTSETMPG